MVSVGWAGWNGFCVAHGMIEAAFLLIGIRFGVCVLVGHMASGGSSGSPPPVILGCGNTRLSDSTAFAYAHSPGGFWLKQPLPGAAGLFGLLATFSFSLITTRHYEVAR